MVRVTSYAHRGTWLPGETVQAGYRLPHSCPPSFSLSPTHIRRACGKSSSSSPQPAMVPLLRDLHDRFYNTRGSGSLLKTPSFRQYVLLAVGLGFLITLSRSYVHHSWRIYPEEEVGFDVPDPHVDWAARANAVKQAFVHAYHGYDTYAFPGDELLPLTNSSQMR